MNFKRKLLLFLISFIIIPFNTFAYSKYLIPGGENIGIKVEADGVYVVGFYKVNNHFIAKEAGLKLGDRIISINDYQVDSVTSLLDKIDSKKDNLEVKFEYIRDGQRQKTIINLKKEKDGTYKTGIYVKDSVTGIGTLTFIDPNDNSYGALGHEVLETKTGINFAIQSGIVFSSKITSITKSSFGKPGEKNARLEPLKVYGNIEKNMETGIYGKLDTIISDSELMAVASLDEVQIGKAEIITVLDGKQKEKFDIEILSIDKKNATKNFLIKVTDEKLIQKAGGIIKGMSGSPIIQNGKIIGAVTHTIIDEPTKGYGISIIKMLEDKG